LLLPKAAIDPATATRERRRTNFDMPPFILVRNVSKTHFLRKPNVMHPKIPLRD
jgi:hypothetical protein